MVEEHDCTAGLRIMVIFVKVELMVEGKVVEG